MGAMRLATTLWLCAPCALWACSEDAATDDGPKAAGGAGSLAPVPPAAGMGPLAGVAGQTDAPVTPASDAPPPMSPPEPEPEPEPEPAADACPQDDDKTEPGDCGCGVPDDDGDGDGSPDCDDACPEDADKTEPGDCGCGAPDADENGDGTTDCLEPQACPGTVGPVPDALRERLDLHPFYQKHVDAGGLPILSSDAPDDAALIGACELVMDMLSERDDVREVLIDRGARFAIIGQDEGTADIPEYGYYERSQAERDQINQRARGLGGQVASCGEENILCLPGDRYWNESICVHEFSHTISTYGLYSADPTFRSRLEDAYDNAMASGLFEDTYALDSVQEYWAEGVQDWYDTNAESIPPNGVHNEIDTREELQSYDPTLYDLIDELLPTDTRFDDCHR